MLFASPLFSLRRSFTMREMVARRHRAWYALMALLLASISVAIHAEAAAPVQPLLNANQWNFILLPSAQVGTVRQPKTSKSPTAVASNVLSVQGLNHSLRLGQMLNTLLLGRSAQVQQIAAYRFDNQDMTALQTIEPYALLQSQTVNVQTLNQGDASVYGSPGYTFAQILANQTKGTYVSAMPVAMISQVVNGLTGSTVELLSDHQYVVVTGYGPTLSANVYDDGIGDTAQYPEIALPKPAKCPQQPITIKAKAPKGLQPYTEQTVYFIRHVEAHPNGNFENGNYVCQGQWRALGANQRLLAKMANRLPDAILTSNPENIIGCAGSCSYSRPSLTIAPFAVAHGLALTLTPFQWQDAEDLAQALFNRNSAYFPHAASNSQILVAWEHDHIVKAVQYVLRTLYHDPKAAEQLPAWSFQDYDSIWKISTDKSGNLTFSNDCEGIDSNALPSTCPAFFINQ